MSMQNITLYNQRMSKALYDKLFFFPRINSEVYVDFGCADGALIGFLAQQSDADFIGFDESPEMIKLANERFGHLPNVKFTTSWDDVKSSYTDPKLVTLILSSVIHEVYSYGSTQSIIRFWNQVFGSGFKHVVIRDMSISEKNAKQIIDLETVSQIRRNLKQKQYLAEFEATWGDISIGINYLHYLLKYRYHENWDREIAENYLPLTTETLLEQIPEKYSITYMSDFTLPYLKEIVRKDFDVDVRFPSHLKLILTLR